MLVCRPRLHPPAPQPIHRRTRFLSNRCRWRQGTEETLSNSIAHHAAACIHYALEALVSVFEFRRCWIRARHQTVKLCRYYSRSRPNNINHECAAGTFCFERGRESPDIPRVEDRSVRFTSAVTNVRSGRLLSRNRVRQFCVPS